MKKKIIYFIFFCCILTIILIAYIIIKKNYQNKKILNQLFEITQNDISNNIFSLQVPDDWIGKIGYIIKKDPDGENDAYHITFIHLDSYKELSKLNSTELNNYVGVIAYIVWHGEKNAFYNYSKGDAFNWEEDKKAAPVSYHILELNSKKTGAYILMLPSDIQFTSETKDDFNYFEDKVVDVIKKMKINVELPD